MLKSAAFYDFKNEKNSTVIKNSDLQVEELNIPDATVHCRIVAMYTRDDQMNLLYTAGKFADIVKEHWSLFVDSAEEHVSTEITSEHGVTHRYLTLHEEVDGQITEELKEVFNAVRSTNVKTHDFDCFRISEIHIEGENQYRGMIMVDGPMTEFDEWFEVLILGEAALSKTDVPIATDQTEEETNRLSNLITDIFDRELRNIHHEDQWEKVGRADFLKHVKFFVERKLTLEACLPAFPCKSSNTLKVAGKCPDKGEELALRRILAFSKLVKEVYSPGIKVWIVSDGHVFSDCIGVDDGIVDQYGAQLKTLYSQISKEDTIGFRSLPELFTSHLGAFKSKYVEDVVLPHYLDSEIKDDAEICRKILMCGCSTDPSILRSMIDANDPAKIALYRGFSRFMFEDLALQPIAMNMSTKGRKKLSCKVAFEMIKRNEAYSNLVGLLLPYHLRLSIHAHNNAGPKYGIRLLSHDKVRTVKSLSLEEMQASDDLLHIPTPWHNCVVDLEGTHCYYVVKSVVVKEALESGEYEGKWIPGSFGEGGRYHLRRVAAKLEDSEKITSTSSDNVPNEVKIANEIAKIELDNKSNEKMDAPARYGLLVDETFRFIDSINILEALKLVDSNFKKIEICLVSKEEIPASQERFIQSFSDIPVYKLAQCPEIDVLIVPGYNNRGEGQIDCSMCKFIADRYPKVKHVFSSGNGSFILSKAGVLDGKKASVGERGKNQAMRSYENVSWITQPWVYCDKIWTSSNMASTMEALFTYIGEVYGKEASSFVSANMGY